MLLIEQFAALALGLANRAYVMEGGRIQYSGTAAELRENPSSCTAPTCCAGRQARTVSRRVHDLPARSPARSMSVTAMEHVLVLSDDIEATREFYCQVVGLSVGDRPPLEFPGYWLYAGDAPCLHIAERRPYLRHAAWIGLALRTSRPAQGRLTTSRSMRATMTPRVRGSRVADWPRSATTSPAVRASCSSRTRTACGWRSTSRHRFPKRGSDMSATETTTTGRRTTPPFRADHVGSLLRPPRADGCA